MYGHSRPQIYFEALGTYKGTEKKVHGRVDTQIVESEAIVGENLTPRGGQKVHN